MSFLFFFVFCPDLCLKDVKMAHFERRFAKPNLDIAELQRFIVLQSWTKLLGHCSTKVTIFTSPIVQDKIPPRSPISLLYPVKGAPGVHSILQRGEGGGDEARGRVKKRIVSY